MPKLLTFLAIKLVLATTSGNAQNPIDSLKLALNQQTNPVARMHIMLEIGDQFLSQNIDSAVFWLDMIIPEAVYSDQSNEEWILHALEGEKYYATVALARSGIALAESGRNIESGVRRLRASIPIVEGLNQPQLAVYCSDNLALILARKGKGEEAAIYFEKSLETYRDLADNRGIAYCLSSLGAIHANLNNLYRAANYFEQLLSMQKDTQPAHETLLDLQNIAALYIRIDDKEKAFKVLEGALSVSQSINDIESQKSILANLGSLAYRQYKLSTAEEFYSRLLERSKKPPQDNENKLMALRNLAIVGGLLDKTNQSIDFWDRSLALAKSLNRIDEQLDALINLSQLNQEINNIERATQYYEQYLSLSKDHADAISIINSYIGVAELQVRSADFQKAREYYASALKLAAESNNIALWSEVNLKIANSFKLQKQYSNAMEFINANLEQKELLKPTSVAEAKQLKAEVLHLQMQYVEALKHYQRALEVWFGNNNRNRAAVCLNAMGAINERMGNMPNAVKQYEQALELAQESGHREAIAAISNNLGVVYRQLGDISRASQSYQQALSIYLELDDADGASYCYNNLGIVYELSGDYQKANEYYEKSIAIKQDTKDQIGLATSLMNMGNVYRFLGNFQKAQEHYNEALRISTEISDQQGRSLALGNKAALSLGQNDYQQAIELARQSLEISEKLDLKNLIKEANRQLAWAYSATHIPEWAEEAYLKVIEMNHEDVSRNFSILSESEKELFFRTVSDDFDRFHSFALQRMHTNPEITRDVYNNQLRNKGLLLKSSTAMRSAILSSNNQGLISSFEEWISVRQEIARLYTLPLDQRPENPEKLEKRANSLERQLVRESSEFSDFEQSLRVDWQSIRNGLNTGEAAIEFTHFTNARDSVTYSALIVLEGYDAPLMIPLFNEVQLERILGGVRANSLDFVNEVYGRNTDINTSLYELIWKPIEPHLHGITEIHVSPSGLLHKVSFAAISSGQNRYLIDDYRLNMVSTTANILNQGGFNLTDQSSVNLFGGITYTNHPEASETWTYLQGTLDETTMISSLLEPHLNSVNLYTDASATEDKFKSLAPKSTILHVATHGFFYPDPEKVQLSIEAATEVGAVDFRGGSPTFGMDNFVNNRNPLMRSGLVFAGVNDFWTGAKPVTGDDGVLTALEVINIDLRENQLVVMSACETGLGEIAGSEGVYGLQRAFKMAGAKYIVMSLWQVPDRETVEFMEIFYEKLLKQNDIRKAFAETQNAMRKNYDPYYWAAFVLIE